MSQTGFKPIMKSKRLREVFYDLRGPVAEAARRLENSGVEVLKLNIGNPAPFGFEAPPIVVEGIAERLATSHGYSDSFGIIGAREAVVKHWSKRDGFPPFGVDDVVLGNGVSELISLVLKALINVGDEILIPTPDYPLWTASALIPGGVPKHYRCVEEEGWEPDLEHMESLISDKTKAIVVINPNNPTGACYSRETLEKIADLARKHSLMILADEIYDQIVYDDNEAIPMASVAPDIPVLSMGGLSKSHRVAGYRAGWLVATGIKGLADDFMAGLTLLSSMRLCANMPGQVAVEVGLSSDASIHPMCKYDGRLYEQRQATYNLVNKIDGLSTNLAEGALYNFVKVDMEAFAVESDQQLVLDILQNTHVLLVPGKAFNCNEPNYLRVVFLPTVEVLTDAFTRIEQYLNSIRK